MLDVGAAATITAEVALAEPLVSPRACAEHAARPPAYPWLGVGLPGHYVVGFFGPPEPLLLDRGVRMTADVPAALVRPWTPYETAMRMLNNRWERSGGCLEIVRDRSDAHRAG